MEIKTKQESLNLANLKFVVSKIILYTVLLIVSIILFPLILFISYITAIYPLLLLEITVIQLFTTSYDFRKKHISSLKYRFENMEREVEYLKKAKG